MGLAGGGTRCCSATGANHARVSIGAVRVAKGVVRVREDSTVVHGCKMINSAG